MPTQARTFQRVDQVLSLQNSSSRREQCCCPALGSQSAFPPPRRPSNLAPTVHTQPRCQSANHDADGAEKPDHHAPCIFSQLAASFPSSALACSSLGVFRSLLLLIAAISNTAAAPAGAKQVLGISALCLVPPLLS